ncbi:unnamed protein product, partial [Hapterophycus canaliculatus]
REYEYRLCVVHHSVFVHGDATAYVKHSKVVMDIFEAHFRRQREQSSWVHFKVEGGRDTRVLSTAVDQSTPCTCECQRRNSETTLQCALVTIDVLRGKLVSAVTS